uniref:Uncharacterized protein n=1 Tax=Magallana gigas TaxID=29159 RepID=K1QQM4_MAGGI
MDSEIDLPEQRIPFFILMNKQVSSDRSSDLLCQIKRVETNFFENKKNIHTIPINGQNARGSFSGS